MRKRKKKKKKKEYTNFSSKTNIEETVIPTEITKTPKTTPRKDNKTTNTNKPILKMLAVTKTGTLHHTPHKNQDVTGNKGNPKNTKNWRPILSNSERHLDYKHHQ